MSQVLGLAKFVPVSWLVSVTWLLFAFDSDGTLETTLTQASILYTPEEAYNGSLVTAFHLRLLLTKGVRLCRHPVPFLLPLLIFGSPATWLCTSPSNLFIYELLGLQSRTLQQGELWCILPSLCGSGWTDTPTPPLTVSAPLFSLGV